MSFILILKNKMEIRETQIDDILISSPALMKETLRLDEEPRLIGRQIIVPSGRLDMLYAYQSSISMLSCKNLKMEIS